jgi:ligand-binding sensor domain-containing protein
MAYELQSTISTPGNADFVLYSNGSIWVGTSTNVFRIDLVTLAVTTVFTGVCSTNLVEDQYGYIWFLSFTATLQRIDPSNNSITTVTVVAAQNTHNRLSLALGELWVTVTNPPNSVDVYRVNPGTSAVTFSFTTTGVSGSVAAPNSFFLEQNGYIWFSRTGFAGHFIGQLDPATNTVVSNTLVNASVAFFQAGIAAYGYVWATSNNGLLRFNTSSLAFAYDGGNSAKALVDYNGSLYTSSFADVFKYDVNTLSTTTIITTTGEQIGDFRFDSAGNLYLAVVKSSGGNGRTLKYVIPAVGWVRGHAWG